MKLRMQQTFEMLPTLDEEEIKSYQDDGFLVIKNLVPSSLIHEIRNSAIKIFKIQLAENGYFPESYEDFERAIYSLFRDDPGVITNCGKHIQHMISLHRLGVSTNVVGILKLLGMTFPNICTRVVMFFNSKQLSTKDIYHTVPAHQDWLSMEGSLDSSVIWFPLVNMCNDLGTLEIVPKSHKAGLITSSVEEGFDMVNKYSDSDFIAPKLEIGDALIFSSFLVHRSGKNLTNSIRWSAHFRFNNLEDSDFIKRKYPHPYIYKPLSKGNSL